MIAGGGAIMPVGGLTRNGVFARNDDCSPAFEFAGSPPVGIVGKVDSLLKTTFGGPDNFGFGMTIFMLGGSFGGGCWGGCLNASFPRGGPDLELNCVGASPTT